MKSKLVLALVSFVLLIGSVCEASFGVNQCLPYRQSRPQKDPGDVFPWGNELPFPWRGIQGIWETSIDGCTSYFSFKPIVASGIKQLKVLQYDPVTCRVISEGSGSEFNRVVLAMMNDKKGNTYRLTIHVFNAADMLCDARLSSKNVTVLNIKALGAPEEDRTSHELIKVSSDPKGICN